MVWRRRRSEEGVLPVSDLERVSPIPIYPSGHFLQPHLSSASYLKTNPHIVLCSVASDFKP